jgi:hypothetical protein
VRGGACGNTRRSSESAHLVGQVSPIATHRPPCARGIFSRVLTLSPETLTLQVPHIRVNFNFPASLSQAREQQQVAVMGCLLLGEY